jgi:hypothetical protein
MNYATQVYLSFAFLRLACSILHSVHIGMGPADLAPGWSAEAGGSGRREVVGADWCCRLRRRPGR